MYSYSEFKKVLENTLGLLEKDIFYIIGIFFEETDGFQKSSYKTFYNLNIDKIVKVFWSASSYEWRVEIYDHEPY